MHLIKDIKENGEMELKTHKRDIVKKFEQALELFLKPIPKKKERPLFSKDDENDIKNTIKRSSEKPITIEDQKNVILSLMLIEFEQNND